MGKPAQVKINSRWASSLTSSGKVWVVIGRKPFGVLELKQEGRAMKRDTITDRPMDWQERLVLRASILSAIALICILTWGR